jgi:gliding motility-associated-like protein
VGGGFSLQWLGFDSYKLTLKLLRDCAGGGAPFDESIEVGVFSKRTNARVAVFSMDFQGNPAKLNFASDGCAGGVENCTEVGVYTKDITLSSLIYNDIEGYYFSWERCCRNEIITNIIMPGAAAMAFYMEIPCPAFVPNSTPYFTSNPNTLLCANNLFQYNLNFVDDDHDDLKYSIVTPLNGSNTNAGSPASNNPVKGPYKTIMWAPGFDSSQSITGPVPLSIDSSTGLISVNPNAAGIYVAAIRIEEFRFGQKIGEVRLDLQFTVIVCPNPPPIVALTDSLGKAAKDTIDFTIDRPQCYKILAVDDQDSVYGKLTSDIFKSAIKVKPQVDTVFNGNNTASTWFCWDPGCEMMNYPPQAFVIDVRDNGCPINRRVATKFFVRVKPRKLVPSTDMLCMTLVDDKETVLYWGDSTPDNDLDFYKYEIYRGIGYEHFVLIDSVFDKKIRSYNDKNSPGNLEVNYTYYMVGVNKCGVRGTTSDTLSTFEQHKAAPDQQFIITATVEDNRRVRVVWPQTWERDFASYQLFRRSAAEGYKMVALMEKPADTIYVDKDVDVNEQSYCYYVVMKDTCGNAGPDGVPACTIVLRGKDGFIENNLAWSAYSGWAGGVDRYKISRSDPSRPFEEINKVPAPALTYEDNHLNLDEGKFQYYVTATQGGQEMPHYFNAESNSNSVTLFQHPVVRFPNAFTANGDELNDQFGWTQIFVKDFQLTIYNRWGQVVFRTNNKFDFWPATSNYQPAAADVYFYICHVTGWDGADYQLKGNFTLLR